MTHARNLGLLVLCATLGCRGSSTTGKDADASDGASGNDGAGGDADARGGTDGGAGAGSAGRDGASATSGDTATSDSGGGDPDAATSACTGTLSFKLFSADLGTRPYTLAAGDFNGDHKLDLAVTNDTGLGSVGRATIALGNGDGTFASALPYPPSPATLGIGAPGLLTTADFNDDGRLDFFLVSLAPTGGLATGALEGNGDGTFTAATAAGVYASTPYFIDDISPTCLGTVDLRGDGRRDVIVSYGDSVNAGHVAVLLDLDDQHFGVKPPKSYDTMASSASAFVAGDFNEDHNLDLATANGSGNVGSISTFLGNGDGTLQLPTGLGVQGNGPYTIAAGDFTGDGHLDLVVPVSGNASFMGNFLLVYPGDGKGGFGAPIANDLGAFPGEALVVGDFNGDGLLDVAYTRDDVSLMGYGVSLALGMGDGTFKPSTYYATVQQQLGPTPYGPQSIAAGDFDGDGNLDLAVANVNGASVSVLVRTGCTP